MSRATNKGTVRDYEFKTKVEGSWAGITAGRNAKEARANAERDLRSEGLRPAGRIDVKRK